MLPKNVMIEPAAAPWPVPGVIGTAAPVNGTIPRVPVAFLAVAVAFGLNEMFPGKKTLAVLTTATLDCVSANVAVDPLYSRLGDSDSSGADDTTEAAAAVATGLLVPGSCKDIVVDALTGEVVSPDGPDTTEAGLMIDVELERTMAEVVLAIDGSDLLSVLNTKGRGDPTISV